MTLQTGMMLLAAKMPLDMMISKMSEGMVETLKIFFLTLLFSLPLGLVIAFGRMAKNRIIRYIVTVYIAIMRGTPLMLQVMAIYFGPNYLLHIRIPRSYRFIAIIVAFALNYAAYFADIYCSGIQSIPVGQYEAAKILGYSKGQTFFKIILPQVIKRILPAVTNEVITLVKDTSLAFVLAVTEMFTLANQVAAAQTTIVPLMAAGVFYYLFNLLVAFVMETLEKKMAYYR